MLCKGGNEMRESRHKTHKKYMGYMLSYALVMSGFLFCISHVSFAASKCGVSPGERVDMPESWTGFFRGGCCHVKDVTTSDTTGEDSLLIISCQDCYEEQCATWGVCSPDKLFTFSECKEYEDRNQSQPSPSVQSTATPDPTPSPTPSFQPKGMSAGTKTVLGLGALGAVGGGVALALGGEEDSSPAPTPTPSVSFTGTFKREYTNKADNGTTIYYTHFLFLTQVGTSVTGTYDRRAVIRSCCLLNVVVPVTGRATGNSLTLSYPSGFDECVCPNGDSWNWNLDGNTENYTIVGNTLQASGTDYSRIGAVRTSATHLEVNDGERIVIEEDFIRQ